MTTGKAALGKFESKKFLPVHFLVMGLDKA